MRARLELAQVMPVFGFYSKGRLLACKANKTRVKVKITQACVSTNLIRVVKCFVTQVPGQSGHFPFLVLSILQIAVIGVDHICLQRCHDTQHNDTQHNNTQHNVTQHNDTQHNDTQHNDTQHNDTQHNDIQHNNK